MFNVNNSNVSMDRWFLHCFFFFLAFSWHSFLYYKLSFLGWISIQKCTHTFTIILIWFHLAGSKSSHIQSNNHKIVHKYFLIISSGLFRFVWYKNCCAFKSWILRFYSTIYSLALNIGFCSINNCMSNGKVLMIVHTQLTLMVGTLNIETKTEPILQRY